MRTLQISAFYFTVFLMIVFLGITCQKQEDPQALSINVAQSSFPCDSLKNVEWGDTLRVVKNTISSGTFKNKKYWQAMLSSNNRIDPTNFQNSATSHRVVIADTTEIKYESIFIVARIK